MQCTLTVLRVPVLDADGIAALPDPDSVMQPDRVALMNGNVGSVVRYDGNLNIPDGAARGGEHEQQQHAQQDQAEADDAVGPFGLRLQVPLFRFTVSFYHFQLTVDNRPLKKPAVPFGTDGVTPLRLAGFKE